MFFSNIRKVIKLAAHRDLASQRLQSQILIARENLFLCLSLSLLNASRPCFDLGQFCLLFFSGSGSVSVNSAAAVLDVASGMSARFRRPEVPSGLLFRCIRAPFRGRVAWRACPTRKGPACDFGRGRRACPRGRRNHDHTGESTPIGVFGSVSRRFNWQCFRLRDQSDGGCRFTSERDHPPLVELDVRRNISLRAAAISPRRC